MKAFIIGAGRVGSSFAYLLLQSGIELLGLYDKDQSAAKIAAENTASDYVSTWKAAKDISRKADLIIFSTPDDLIKETAENLEPGKEQYLMHLSGLLKADILPNNVKGLFSMHPLQSIASFSEGIKLLPNSLFTLEGNKKGLKFAEELIEKLGVECVIIESEFKPLYHAAAVMASNYLVTLINQSFRLLRNAGLENSELKQAIIALSRGTLANIEELGIERALTGPIARGDFETILKHQQTIEKFSQEQLEIYNILGEYTLQMLPAEKRLKSLFREGKIEEENSEKKDG